MPARQARQIFHPVDHPPDERDIAVEMARRMADDGVELGAGAGIGREIAPDADHAVAMDGPVAFDRRAAIRPKAILLG